MGKPTGFIEIHRKKMPTRPVAERLKDWNEVYLPYPKDELQKQGARCMDCGIPFCHQGCPLGNLIPDWNDLVYRNRWEPAIERLHATNNFPEFTGRLCPAPCEGSCVLGINAPPVTIKNIEVSFVDRGFDEGWIVAEPPSKRTGKKVAVIGSGPAGLAAAVELNKAGHLVTVFERADRIGGLLTYGIPPMKLEKPIVDRRVKLLADEGITFVTNTEVGKNYPTEKLRKEFDSVVLCGGATWARDLPVDGRGLKGIHLAMDFLTLSTKSLLDSQLKDGRYISAKDKRVVVIGGGDTGTDCVGTSLRHGCKSLLQLEIMPRPPEDRAADNPWPQWPKVYKLDYGQEEAAALYGADPRQYAVTTKRFVDDGHGSVTALVLAEVRKAAGSNSVVKFEEVPGSERTIPADLVLLAMGFLGPERKGLLDDLAVALDPRGNVKVDADKMTSVPGIFAAGDMSRGQSLIVWAIAEGREAARGVDKFLMGETVLS